MNLEEVLWETKGFCSAEGIYKNNELLIMIMIPSPSPLDSGSKLRSTSSIPGVVPGERG